MGYNDEHAKKKEYVTSERNDSLAFSLYPSPRPENISVQMLHVNTTGDFKWNSKAMQNRGMSSLQLFQFFLHQPNHFVEITSANYVSIPQLQYMTLSFCFFLNFKTHLNYI